VTKRPRRLEQGRVPGSALAGGRGLASASVAWPALLHVRPEPCRVCWLERIAWHARARARGGRSALPGACVGEVHGALPA
jgi:hypothetical protein